MTTLQAPRPDAAFEHANRRHHAERGSYGDVGYAPVFRASGIFYACVDRDLNTIITFMNYWREKNEVASLGTLVTLRDASGRKTARRFFRLDDAVCELDVRAISGRDKFEGSLEVEFYASEDLKFGFPAMCVAYETSQGIGYVHTNQRTFNNYEDEIRSEPLNHVQTGFDIHADDASGFVFLVNGPRAEIDRVMSARFTNAAGKSLERTIPIGRLEPYAARRIELGNVEGLRSFLGGQVGFARIDAGLGSVFNRFAVGNRRHDDGWLSVTHSYFDCTDHADFFDSSKLAGDEYPCFIPFNLVDGLETELVFYPIMAPTRLQLRVHCYDESGAPRAQYDLPELFETAGKTMRRIDVRALLRSIGIAAEPHLYCLHVESPDGRIPSRATFGLNYRRTAALGTNISSSALHANTHGTRKRAWLWGPAFIRNGARNYALVSAYSKHRRFAKPSEFTLSLYDSKGVIARRTIGSGNGRAHNILVEDLLSPAQRAQYEGRSLWYVLQSDDPIYVANNLHVSASGRVGGDHSF
jgi:hypothetical protein